MRFPLHSNSGAASRALLAALLAGVLIVIGGVLLLLRSGGNDKPLELAEGVASAAPASSVELAESEHGKSADAHDKSGRSGAFAAGVRLAGPGRLDGRVLERATGRGVGGVSIALTPVPPAGATLLGRMLRMLGGEESLSNRVLPIAVAISSDDGVFHFKGVRTGTWYLDARGDHFVPETVVRARLLASGAGGPLDVWVAAGGRVLGRILMPDGSPARGAMLALVPGPASVLTSARTGDLRWLEVKSDDDGAFAIPGVPAGDGYEITASGKGFALSHLLAISVRAGEDTRVTVQTNIGGTIVGRVLCTVKGGEPVPLADAHLGASPRGLRNLRCAEEVLLATHCVSAADGSFVMERVPVGEVDLIAIERTHLPAIGARVTLADGARVQSEDIVLKPGMMIPGKVVDAEGRPVAGASTRFNLVDWKNFRFDFTLAPMMAQAVEGFDLPKTDAEGKFLAGPIAGEAPFDVTFSKLGYVDAELHFDPAKDGPEALVTMHTGGAVEGVVMDALKSEPVTSFMVSGPDRVDVESDAPGSKNPFSGGQTVEDQAGRFHVESVRSGKSSLVFGAPSYLNRTVDVDVVEGQVTKGVIVELSPGGVVRGRVIDADGLSIAGAQVVAQSDASKRTRPRDRTRRGGRGNGPPRGPLSQAFEEGGDAFPPGMMAFAAGMGFLGDKPVMTDANGAFEIRGVDAGSFHVLAFHRDHCSATSDALTMTDAGLVEKVVLRMPNGGGIHGTVGDRFGRPVGDELVIAFSPSGFTPGAVASGGGLFQGATDDKGHYEMRHVSPGSYFLVATRGDQELNPATFFGTMNFDLVTVPPDEDVEFDLVDNTAGACKVHGTITYRGDPVPRGSLVALNYDTESMLGVEFRAAKMRDGGRFEFAGLAPGDYELNFDGDGPQVRMRLTVPDLPDFDVVLRVPEAGVEGRVVDDRTNTAVEGADLVLRPLDAPQAKGLLGSMMAGNGRAEHAGSGTDGTFAFERLAEGEYELVARAPRHDNKRAYAPSDPIKVRIENDRTERGITVRLLPALGVSGRVVDTTGAPVKDATVLVFLEKGTLDATEHARTDDQGHFEVSGLSPGKYRASVTADGYAAGGKDGIQLERGHETSDIEVVLSKGAHVTARIFDHYGVAVSGARAQLLSKKASAAPAADPGRALEGFFTGKDASGTDGIVELGRFLPGQYQLDAQRGSARASQDVTIDGQHDEVELRIDLP